MSPLPDKSDKSLLAFDNEFGSTCISLPKSFHTLNKIEFTLFIFPRCETREDKKGGCLMSFRQPLLLECGIEFQRIAPPHSSFLIPN